jgi:hypothetical protein
MVRLQSFVKRVPRHGLPTPTPATLILAVNRPHRRVMHYRAPQLARLFREGADLLLHTMYWAVGKPNSGTQDFSKKKHLAHAEPHR